MLVWCSQSACCYNNGIWFRSSYNERCRGDFEKFWCAFWGLPSVLDKANTVYMIIWKSTLLNLSMSMCIKICRSQLSQHTVHQRGCIILLCLQKKEVSRSSLLVLVVQHIYQVSCIWLHEYTLHYISPLADISLI